MQVGLGLPPGRFILWGPVKGQWLQEEVLVMAEEQAPVHKHLSTFIGRRTSTAKYNLSGEKAGCRREVGTLCLQGEE